MSKTPVTLLQEAAVSHNLKLHYQELSPSREGAQSIFKIQVRCAEYVTEGTAMTKKGAKHDAARKMLMLLCENNVIPSSLLTNLLPAEHSASPAKDSNGDQRLANYVGLLNEYCQQTGLPLPTYSTSNGETIRNMQTFVTTCTVGGTCKEGRANCKKVAKQLASEQVLNLLREDWKLDNKLCKADLSNIKTTELIEKLGLDIDSLRLDKQALDASEIEMAQAQYTKAKTKRPKVDLKLVGEQHNKIAMLINALKPHQRDTILLMRSNDMANSKVNIERAICEAFQVSSVQKFVLHGGERDIFLVGCKLQTEPPVIKISKGTTIEGAEMGALKKILDLIVFYLSA